MSLCLRGIYIETRLFNQGTDILPDPTIRRPSAIYRRLEMAGFTEGLGLSGDAILYSFFPGLFTLKVSPQILFSLFVYKYLDFHIAF